MTIEQDLHDCRNELMAARLVLKLSKTWIPIMVRKPAFGQMVLLANIRRLKSEDSHGCHKDVGVLRDGGGQPYWSTQGEMRATDLSAFTHWLPIPADPQSETEGEPK